MACTKQVYSITSTWTPAQLAQSLEDAFVDAGLMTAWYDSFLSGSVENRVLEVVYDGTKIYGTTYYWWMFTTAGVYLHVATGWDAIAHVPVGTEYVDFFTATTNSVINHWQMFAASTSDDVELVRYTSGIDANQSWFVIKRAGNDTNRTFTIVKGLSVQPWLDLDKGFFEGFVHATAFQVSFVGNLAFRRGPSLRREIGVGTYLYDSTFSSVYTSNIIDRNLISYAAVGRGSGVGSSNYPSGSIYLPTALATVNPAYTENSNPVFHSLPFSPYVSDSLPSDFGLTFHYDSNAFELGDTLLVTQGSEEWEVLAENPSTTVGAIATPLFLARMV